ncbi:hypothetical protein BUALT_Bualt11G0045900 [Buddleja alternifolia]|uniref:Gamma-secretase subunit PEN-2 n=1 Tax=Buddleja alternifolia TaxID=168488 RepID=A0AAV6WRJ5_9LAMI|nr:hypothetical protein BUALT_Bualt11G0045900 [Buddleja alternifolia]
MENDSRNPTSSDLHANHAAVLPTINDPSPPSRRISVPAEWPTIDGPLGLSNEDSLTYARRFFQLGFLCLPFLWAVNCFYFWPILRHPQSHHSHPHLRR